jgi:mono/diheme cytochrome c family protein
VNLAAAALVVTQLGLVALERRSWSRDPFNDEFEVTCGECHPASRAHAFALSPDGWRRKVTAMFGKRAERSSASGRQPLAVDERRIDTVTAFLADHRSADGRTLFHARCGRCHSPTRIDPYLDLEPEALRLLIAQHVRANNAYVQTWEGELIAERLLADRRPNLSAASAVTPGDATVYQRDCGTCHTPRMIRREVCARAKSPAARAALVARMRAKAPDFVGEGDIPALRRYVETLCASGKVAP